MTFGLASQQAHAAHESPAQTIMRLEEENRWLKSYLGETLKELHLLQARMYGKVH